jgi:hypothetical protein
MTGLRRDILIAIALAVAIVLVVLFTYFLYRQLGARGIAVAGIALGALAVVVFLSPDTMLHKRITLADDELQQWRTG